MTAISIQLERGTRNCPLCLDVLTLGLARCTLCNTRHHAACAVELGRGACATPGCRGRLQTPLTRCDHCAKPLTRGGLVHPRCGGLIHAACLAVHVPACIAAHPIEARLRPGWGTVAFEALATRVGPTCPGCDELLAPGRSVCLACAPRPRAPRTQPRRWTRRVWARLNTPLWGSRATSR